MADALGVEPKLVHISSDTLAKLWPECMGGLWGDKSHTVLFDNSKIKRAVPEFCAKIRFDQGVKESVKYVYSHPELQVLDPEFDSWCDRVIEAYERMVDAMPKMGE